MRDCMTLEVLIAASVVVAAGGMMLGMVCGVLDKETNQRWGLAIMIGSGVLLGYLWWAVVLN